MRRWRFGLGLRFRCQPVGNHPALMAKCARRKLTFFAVKAASFENFDDFDVRLGLGKAGIGGVGKIFETVTIDASGAELR